MDRWITDWTISPTFPLLTRANAGEVLPGPCSPLGWTLVWEPGCCQGWRDAAVLDYSSQDPDELDDTHPEVVGTLGGYLYANATHVRVFGARGPGLSPEGIGHAYFGEHPEAPPFVLEDWHENPAASERVAAWMTRVLAAEDLPDVRADRALAESTRSSRPVLSKMDDQALVDRARSMAPAIRRLFRRHVTETAAAAVGVGILGAMASTLGDPSTALRLIAAIGDMESAAPSRALWALSRVPVDSPGYLAGFGDFIRRSGSRGPNELDIRSEVWETEPALVTRLVEVMRSSTESESPERRNERNRTLREVATEAVREQLAGFGDATREQFESALRSAQLHLRGRDQTQANVVRVVHEVRMAMRELGSRSGYTASQTCMLLLDELDAFVASPDDFRARLSGREEQYLTLWDLEPPFFVHGEVPPLSEWARRGSGVVVPVEHGEQIIGIPGAPGRAVGPARIIAGLAEACRVEPGDILLARVTDPSWAPLFVAAGAVLVDVGAPTSDVVIVSRELGIPCVVGVQDASRRIADGTMLVVDGDAGTVTVLPLD